MIITLDYETAWGDDYTLSKMTTEAYVRDTRFKCHGVAVKFDGRPAAWFPPSVFENEKFRAAVRSSAMLAHHAQFDGLILSHHYDLRPALWLDTLSMARIAVPHERHSLDNLSKYFGLPGKMHQHLVNTKGVWNLTPDQWTSLGVMSCDDADKTYKIFQYIKGAIPKEEFSVIDMTIRMFTEPVLELDVPKLTAYHAEVVTNKQASLDEIGLTKKDLGQDETVAAKYRELGIEPDTKVTGKGNTKYAFAKTDQFMRDMLEDEDDRVANLTAARLGIKSTIEETRSTRLIEMAQRGTACVYLRYAGAHTTRWSGGDKLNWQNFSVRKTTTIRESIKPPTGYKAVTVDSSQIQCRIVNGLAGQQDVLERFRLKQDPYVGVASQFYGRQITKADKAERQFGKVVELGCGFQMGGKRFKEVCRIGPLGGDPIHISPEEAERAVQTYRQSHPFVARFWKDCDEYLNILMSKERSQIGPLELEDGAVWLPNGVPMWYDQQSWRPDKESGKPKRWAKIRGRWTTMYGGKFTENIVQALERVFIAERAAEIKKKYPIVNIEHDGIWLIAPIDDDQCIPYCVSILSRSPEWMPELPVDAEGVEGASFGK